MQVLSLVIIVESEVLEHDEPSSKSKTTRDPGLLGHNSGQYVFLLQTRSYYMKPLGQR